MKIIGDNEHLKTVPEKLLKLFPDDIYLVCPNSIIPKDIPKDRCIGLIEKANKGTVVNLLFDSCVPHILQLGSENFLDELYIAGSMISSPDVFFENGIVSLLTKKVFDKYKIDNYEEVEFNSRDDKKNVMAFFMSNIAKLPRKNTIEQDVAFVVDELFTNAIFNAPAQKDYGEKTLTRLNLNDIIYSFGNVGRFRFGANEKYVFIECTDPYGSLIPKKIFQHIRNTYLFGVRDTISMSEKTGAGIGVRYVYDLSVSYNVLVNKDKATSICCIIPYGMSTKKKEKISRSIHVLYSEGKMSDFSYTEEMQGDTHLIKLAGHINEDSILKDIKLSKSQDIVMDFQNIVGVNSCGIREWIKWLSELPPGANLTWKHCTKEIIDQVNMVEGFLPKKAKIVSFYIPYFCDECENRTNISQSASSKNDLSYEEEIECPHCSEKAEIDVIENKYFKFLP